MGTGRGRRDDGALPPLAAMLAAELASGQPGDTLRAILPMLANASAIGRILGDLFAAASRNPPREDDVAAHAFLLEQALTELRLAANGGDAAARRAVGEVGQRLERLLAGKKPGSEALLLVARAFAAAQLDPGDALRRAVAAALEAEPVPGGASAEPGQLAGQVSAHLAKVARAVGNDPFALHAEVTATGVAFSPERRAAMAVALAEADAPAAREASIGAFLDADPGVGEAVAAALSRPDPKLPVSSRMVEWLVRLRPWLAESRHAAVDAAIRALRPRAAPPGAPVQAEFRTALASMCDGAGAQSLFAVLRQGRRQAVASILVKTGEGVTDVWVQAGLRKAEADGMMEEITEAVGAAEVSLDFLQGRLADALATHLETGRPPPFGLVQVVETIGLGPLPPARITPAVLAESLIEELPAERKGPEARRAAHQLSASWPSEIDTVGSWFEAGEAVDALLRPLRGREKRIEAVLTEILPARRGFWAERCAWTAATLREESDGDDELWASFAFVAQDLAGETPLADIPLARLIAEATVDAFSGR